MRVHNIRSLKDENAGFIYDISQLILKQVIKEPSLLPDLSSDKTIFMFSDYSKVRGKFKTYSFLAIGRKDADYFNGMRKILRDDFGLSNRRMSYKGLNDKLKLNALPAFLSCAGSMNGLIVTYAVDTRIKHLFADVFLDVEPDLAQIKKGILEDSLRIAHFGSQVVMNTFSNDQNIVWITDADSIVANEDNAQFFGRISETLIRYKFLPDAKVNRIGFGITEDDDGSLEFEDFVSIPDLVAGAICETLDRMGENNIKVRSKISILKPSVSRKTDIICDWIGKTQCPLKKFMIVINKCGSRKQDFQSTFFKIENPKLSQCEIDCNLVERSADIYDPIRFDINDY